MDRPLRRHGRWMHPAIFLQISGNILNQLFENYYIMRKPLMYALAPFGKSSVLNPLIWAIRLAASFVITE
jgi:hypothetical protein